MINGSGGDDNNNDNDNNQNNWSSLEALNKESNDQWPRWWLRHQPQQL